MINTARKLYPAERGQMVFENLKHENLPQTTKFLFNRELSLIEFFRSVLIEGLDESNPLLERLKFLSIFSSNVDEFFMIRVSGLKEKSNKFSISTDGMSVPEQLREIREQLTGMIDKQMKCLREDLYPRLAEQGINILSYDSLATEQKQKLDEYFRNKVYPILTPQAVDPSHPFPYISGNSLNIGLNVRPKLNRRVAKILHKTSDQFFVRIKIPDFTPRLVKIGKSADDYILLEDLIKANIQTLVPEGTPEACHMFRINRDADIDIREDEAEDLLQTMEQNLLQRRFGDVVRLEVAESMPATLRDYLIDSLQITPDDVYVINGPLNITDFMSLYGIDRPDLKDAPLRVFRPSVLNENESIFETITRQDVLLHHPYMPYDIVTDFIREAAEDPDVLAIKMCLYRIGANSPIAPLLIRASERGKQVTVLIELKARFDEENNIEWAKRLERAGVHVIYGILGLKIHCKTTLIVRREGDDLKRYVHLATGNYNPQTSAFYTDLGLLTDDPQIGADSTELFNFLTAYSHSGNFEKLMVAPLNLRERMLEMIRRETDHARNGRPARIVAKMNRLADVEIIQALYEASQSGVQIDLIVRGICMLRPGVPGLSENIRVRSIVGQLLEHSRLYYFANDGDERIFMGSSDWMPRNLDRRVEVIGPIEDPQLKEFLKDNFLAAYLRDNVKARILMPDGSYDRAVQVPDEAPFDSQLSFQEHSNVVKFEKTSNSDKEGEIYVQ